VGDGGNGDDQKNTGALFFDSEGTLIGTQEKAIALKPFGLKGMLTITIDQGSIFLPHSFLLRTKLRSL
jgi:hypothetical protein